LVISNAAGTLPTLQDIWLQPRIVHRRIALVRFPTIDKRVDGSLSLVLFFNLTSPAMPKEKNDSSNDSSKCNQAYDNAYCYANGVGFFT
jgi:hypothetical protein